ncbi:MAG: LysM peptidoglycan-binding domain-containing protein [Anaerolineae bacterium]
MVRGLWRMALVAFLCLVIGGLWLGAGVAQADGPIYHTVRRGENLSYISRLYGVSVWDIARANGIWNPNVIYVGQTLYIPPGGPYYVPRVYWQYPSPGPRYCQAVYGPAWGYTYPCYYPYYYPYHYPYYYPYHYPYYYPCYYDP